MAAKRKSNKKTRKKKKQLIPPAFIVGGIFFVMVLLIILAVINIKVKNLEKDIKLEQSKFNYARQIEKDIKAIFYDLEIDKSFAKHELIKENKKILLKYYLKLNKNEVDTLFYNIGNLLKKEKFKISYFSENELSAENEFIKIVFKVSRFKKSANKTNKEMYLKNKNNNHRLSIIIDDCGNNINLAKKLASIPYPITMSVIPFLKYSKETVKIAKQHNKTVFLHLPMQPKTYPNTDPGKGAIFLNTPKSLIEIIIRKDVEDLGFIEGANNHMGSALTENREKMQQVLNALKKYTDTFIDSHTSTKTVAYNVCKSLKMKCGMNRKFIDNVDDKNYIREKLYEVLSLFEKYNTIIIIGHLKENTIQVLKEELPHLQQKGIKITNIKEVLN
ncbi:divergent polysaccharide deacetylase family protein [Deferribacter autotrophicus]|uniref:Divergent polysaccharide deacetylase family protein n=1 Tax=Deferribacter autotrophicus TaxID=500465 RepID=A0A5A8F6Q1_9BACT|nr:divergent polysaccharide deacetylase family protein [Deferribacter autotrophicus]KAA0257404.1 divergent polysaccharide deacetylase family protein [Deferribacter autotrophicus]